MAFLRLVLILLILVGLGLIGLYVYGASLKAEVTERTAPAQLDLDE